MLVTITKETSSLFGQTVEVEVQRKDGSVTVRKGDGFATYGPGNYRRA